MWEGVQDGSCAKGCAAAREDGGGEAELREVQEGGVEDAGTAEGKAAGVLLADLQSRTRPRPRRRVSCMMGGHVIGGRRCAIVGVVRAIIRRCGRRKNASDVT